MSNRLTSAGVSPAAAKASASAAISAPNGRKNMLATECSNPPATKAVTGRNTASSLSVTVRPAVAIHTPRHTSMLATMPRRKAISNGRFTLPLADVTEKTENE